MASIGLIHFLIVSIALASAGLATILTKRNAIGILIGVELILNAAAINFVAFSRFQPWVSPGAGVSDIHGQVAEGSIFTLFIIVLAAAEAAVALAIILNYYHRFGSIDVEQAQTLKG